MECRCGQFEGILWLHDIMAQVTSFCPDGFSFYLLGRRIILKVVVVLVF